MGWKETNREQCSAYKMANLMDESFAKRVVPLAKRVQFATWTPVRLMKSICRRELPFFKFHPYVPTISRKQRYAIASCGMLLGAFISAFLFRVDCSTTPKPESCKTKTLFEKCISWDVVFATIWALILS